MQILFRSSRAALHPCRRGGYRAAATVPHAMRHFNLVQITVPSTQMMGLWDAIDWRRDAFHPCL